MLVIHLVGMGKFSEPYLTTSWEVVEIINQEVLDLLEHSDILDTVEFDTVDVVVESPQGEIMDTMTIEVEQNMDIAMEIETEIDIPEIEVEELPEISLEIEEMSNVEESNLEGETQQAIQDKKSPLVMRGQRNGYRHRGTTN